MTHNCWADGTRRIARIEPPDGPLTSLRVVRAQRDGAISISGHVQRVLLQVSHAVHQWPIASRAFEIHPFVAVQFLAMMMHAPIAYEEIKVAGARGQRWSCLLSKRSHHSGGAADENHKALHCMLLK